MDYGPPDLDLRVLPIRVELVELDAAIESIYSSGGTRAAMGDLPGGKATPDTAAAMLEAHREVRRRGGRLAWSDVFRWDSQRTARRKYLRWLGDGKPSGDDFNPKLHKAAFVAPLGASFHNAGRAGDCDYMKAAPASVARDQRLDWLWDVLIPRGFRPAIAAPTEGKAEAWHFDYMGPWAPVFDRLGYAQAAKGAVLDVGLGDDVYPRAWWCWVQAQLQRAGYDVGEIDGHPGRLTRAGLAAVGLPMPDTMDHADEVEAALLGMDSAPLLWTP